MAILSPRMKNWLEGLGGHIATANKQGIPLVVVTTSAEIINDENVRFPLSTQQVDYIKDNIDENPIVAIGIGGIGSIRAAYQFKGIANLESNQLSVNITEIYCTKPGPEAGLRLDILPLESVIKFEETRWKDNGPPK